MSVDRRFKADPYKYAKAIGKRAKRIEGIHRVTMTFFREKVILEVTFEAPPQTSIWRDPPDVMVDGVDRLRREFSAAFPSWGIEARYKPRYPVRIVPVLRSFILGDRIFQDLECGHRVDAGRLKAKRRCECCAVEAHPAASRGES